MTSHDAPECVVIGYNDPPFESYESLLRSYGEHAEAYRDLRLNFVTVDDARLSYVGLINHVLEAARGPSSTSMGSRLESGDIPNLAAAYLTSHLRRHGIAADYVNLFQLERERLAAQLAQDPLCVAITTTFYVINYPLYEMVQFIRERNPRVRIVVGGPLIANHLRNFNHEGLDTALRDIGADVYVTDSQGEETLVRIVECLKSGGDLSTVPNLAYFADGRLVRTGEARENNSLDENYIDWTIFADKPLGATIQTRTARSCAFNCAFCNYPTRAGKLTLAGLDTVERELDSMSSLGSVRNVVFIDDTFNVPLPRFKDLCRLMIRKQYGFNWFSYFRCSNSDEEAIALMAESGCKGVFLGIESGSPTILKNMNKAATIEKYAQGIRLLHEAGVLTFGSFILGFPGETAETVAETMDFIRTHRPTCYRVQPWYCEAGTPIDRQRDKYGIAGDGFVWSHATMDSQRAVDHIERIFLSIDESIWLPQWSFDFWIIPYLMGRGISVSRFSDFMRHANRLLALEVAAMEAGARRHLQAATLTRLIATARQWLDPASPAPPADTWEAERARATRRPERPPVADLEALLATHPQVVTSAVVHDPVQGVVAFYSSRAPIDPAALRAFVAERGGESAVPRRFVHLPRLRRALDGSIDYAELPPVDDAPARGARAGAARSPTEEVVARVWRSVLAQREIDIHTPFGDLGGDAIAAARILIELRDTFQLVSPLPGLEATATIAGQAVDVIDAQAAQLTGDELTELMAEIRSMSGEALQRALVRAAQS